LTEDEGPLAGLIYITAREDIAQLVGRAADAAWIPDRVLSSERSSRSSRPATAPARPADRDWIRAAWRRGLHTPLAAR
jgi:hypothetical protein